MQKLSFENPVDKTLTSQMCGALARRIKDDINRFCVDLYTDEHRTHLGASIIGEECGRMIWYAFRWCQKEIFDGRQLRLFNRGHREEARWLEWLRGVGFTVFEVDPNTGKQFKIWGARGHYGGSTDSIATLPYPELIGLTLLCEFKTHNAGSFAKLLKDGVIISKPQHYAQMCSYGGFYRIHYGMYCASGKNDDDIHIEIVKLDPRFADDLSRKAEDIIFSPVPPPKISLQPTFHRCQWCSFNGICHHNQPVEKNCRSCRRAQPVDNAQWYCTLYMQTIPEEFIPKGCDKHESIAQP